MIVLAHMRIADLIEDAGTPCYVGDPPKNYSLPFCFVLGGVPFGRARTVAGNDRSVDETLIVRVVAKQSPDALILASEIADLLDEALIQVDGWRAFPLKVESSDPVMTDRTTFNEQSNTYPAWVNLHVRLRATKEAV